MKIKTYIDGRKPSSDGRMPVMLSVNIRGERFFLATGLYTTEKFKGEQFPMSQTNSEKKSLFLRALMVKVEEYIITHQDWSNDELKARLKREIAKDAGKSQPSERLTDYFVKFIDTIEKDGTKTIYRRTLVRIEEFDKKVMLNSVTASWLQKFRSECLKDLSVNTVAIYLRNIRAVFNWCRRRKYTQNDPFLDFRIVTEQTRPNNIPVEKLREFLCYPCETWQEPYRDFFKLSVLLAGINPVDLLSLRSDAIKDGHLTFVRRKTNKSNAATIRIVQIPVYEEAQEIIDRYQSKEGWLLSFMDARNNYRSFARECNDALKKIGPSEKVKDKVGKLRKMSYHPICPDITLYSARYSFGSIAVNDLDISEHTVGMCLGHSWAKSVTSHYISTDQKKIDKAVRRVIDYILYNKE